MDLFVFRKSQGVRALIVSRGERTLNTFAGSHTSISVNVTVSLTFEDDGSLSS